VSRAATTARTLWDVMIAEPVRGGRLRLDGLPPVVRQLSIAGAVVLSGLLVSLILNDAWRHGPLTLVRDFDQAPNLAATGVIPFTLIAIAVAWALILAGAAVARPLVAVLVGSAFLLANAGITHISVISADSLVLRAAPDVALTCYFLAPAVAVAVSLLRRAGWGRAWRVLGAGVLAAAVVGFFGSHLVVYAVQESRGDLAILPRTLDGTLNELQGFLVPLFILAVAGLVQLNHHVAEAVATPFWDAPAWLAKLLVLALIAVKLRYALLGRVDHWVAYVGERGPQAAQAVAYVAFLGGAAWLIARTRTGDDVPTEGLVYGGSILLSSALLISGLVTNVALFLISRGAIDAARWVDRNFPLSFVAKYLLIGVSAVALVLGAALVVRGRRRVALGAALVVLGGWVLPNVVLQQVSDRDIGFDIGFVDLLLTLVALGYIALRWRRLTTAGAVRIGALLVFASLVAGNGYVATRVVSRVLAYFTPPAVLLIVIGVLYVVFADSAFASASSPNFPRETRALLWIGYLIFSVAVTNYVLVAREAEYRIEFDRFAFHFLALPRAAWLGVRRPFGAGAGPRVSPTSRTDGAPAAGPGPPAPAG
jgi:hypothetical protein